MRTRQQLKAASIPGIKANNRQKINWLYVLHALEHVQQPERELITQHVIFGEPQKLGVLILKAIEHQLQHDAEHEASHVFQDNTISLNELDEILQGQNHA